MTKSSLFLGFTSPATAWPAPAHGAGAAASGSAFGAGLTLVLPVAALLGLAPSVRISVTRTIVNSWRWPRLRREFLRRRFLNAMTFGPRPCSSTSAATEAPATAGAPMVTLSPPTTSTSPNWTISPGSPATLSTLITSSAATRYCLPPVRMTANIVFVLVFESRPSRGRLLSVGLGFKAPAGLGLPVRAVLWRRKPKLSRNPGISAAFARYFG